MNIQLQNSLDGLAEIQKGKKQVNPTIEVNFLGFIKTVTSYTLFYLSKFLESWNKSYFFVPWCLVLRTCTQLTPPLDICFILSTAKHKTSLDKTAMN